MSSASSYFVIAFFLRILKIKPDIIAHLSNKACNSYETNKFKNKYCKPSQFFEYVDKRTKITSDVDNIMVGDNLISDTYEKANALNDHYVRVYTRDNGISPTFVTPILPQTAEVIK